MVWVEHILLLNDYITGKVWKHQVTKHIQNCYTCQQRNRQVIKYQKLHFDTASFPKGFISMDLIGEFHPPSKKGHRYALTCNLYANWLHVLCSVENQNG